MALGHKNQTSAVIKQDCLSETLAFAFGSGKDMLLLCSSQDNWFHWLGGKQTDRHRKCPGFTQSFENYRSILDQYRSILLKRVLSLRQMWWAWSRVPGVRFCPDGGLIKRSYWCLLILKNKYIKYNNYEHGAGGGWGERGSDSLFHNVDHSLTGGPKKTLPLPFTIMLPPCRKHRLALPGKPC